MTEGKILYLRYKQRLLGLLIKNGRLLSVNVYDEAARSLTGNIYVGKVQHISKNIQAAFVEFDKGKLAFLSYQEICSSLVLNRPFDGSLHEGDEVVVQVIRDGINGKRPSLTTNISLAGNYLVISRDSTHLGLSLKLSEEKKRALTTFLTEHGLCDAGKTCVQSEDGPDHFGMIVRTNAGNLNDFSPLLQEWDTLRRTLGDICREASYRTCFSCLYQKKEPFIEDLKNYNTEEYGEIVTDCPDIYQILMEEKPSAYPRIRFYEDEYPLAKLYSVGTLLHEALDRRVHLKSGAYLIIEPTEALTSIDVNTGKYEAGRNSEDTFFRINREAAAEIAIQLRLRNLSGMILVDFINMSSEEHNRELLNYLRGLTAKDSVHTCVVDMTPLGLVEITRKRVNRPLQELLSQNTEEK